MSSVPLRVAALLVLCAHLALSYSHNYLLGANDDRLWLYATGAEFGRQAQSDALNARTAEALRAGGRHANTLFRFDARAAYHRNYVAASAVYRLVADAVRRNAGDVSGTAYPGFVSRAMFWGYLAAYAAACGLLVLVVAGTRDTRWIVGVACAIALIAFLETVFDLAGDTWSGLPVLLPDAQTSETFWPNFWPNFTGLILNPQVQMSPFGDTPRNHFVLLTLTVFILRWRQAYAASYLCVMALSFVHQSQTGLLAAYLVGTDALLRPRLFTSRAAVVILGVLGLFAGRETLGGAIGITRVPVILALAAAVALVAALIAAGLKSGAGAATLDALGGVRQRLLARGVVAADLIAISTAWVVTFPIAYAINALGSEIQSIYFWTQLHGRSMGLFRPAFILGLTLFGLDRLSRTRETRRVMAAATATAALALVPSAYQASGHDRDPVGNLQREVQAVDARVPATLDWTRIGASSEEEIYYSIARDLDLSGDISR